MFVLKIPSSHQFLLWFKKPNGQVVVLRVDRPLDPGRADQPIGRLKTEGRPDVPVQTDPVGELGNHRLDKVERARVWLGEAPILLADEVVYHYAGGSSGAYTVTQPFGMVHSAGFGSVVQLTANPAPVVAEAEHEDTTTTLPPPHPHDGSILVIATLPLLIHAEQIPTVLDQLQHDHQALCGPCYKSHEQVCDWHVLVVLARADFRPVWEEQDQLRHGAADEPRIQWTMRMVEEEAAILTVFLIPGSIGIPHSTPTMQKRPPFPLQRLRMNPLIDDQTSLRQEACSPLVN